MAQLSQEEINAGISRSALAKIRRNGQQTMTLGDHLKAREESGTLQPERLYIIDTFDRSFDIVNLDGWRFRIRDLRRQDSSIYCVELALDRPELERLVEVAARILSDTPATKSLKARNEK